MKYAPLATAILLLLCFSANAQTRLPDDGQVKDGVYFNSFFSFSFEYPKDWVVHDDAINQRIQERAKEEAVKSGTSAQMKDAYLLITFSRYPLGQQTGALNPTILVAAERIPPQPGTPNGKDYLTGLREHKQKRGVPSVLNEPVEFRVDGFQFFRDDYSGRINGVVIRQSTFVTMKKGYVLVFSFTGEDEKSVAEMAQMMNKIFPIRTITTVGTPPTPERKPD